MSVPRKIGGGRKLQTYDESNGEYDNRNGEYKKLNEKTTEELKKEARKELPKKKKEVEVVKDIQKTIALNSDRQEYTRTLTKERVEKLWGYGEPEMQETTCRLFNEDSFGIGKAPTSRKTAYYPGFNKVGYMETADGENCYSNGGVWYHEVWHAIDANYGELSEQELEDAKNRFMSYGYDEDRSNRLAAEAVGRNKCLSSSYILSTGKTFQETLIEEYNQRVNASEVVARFKKEVDDYYTSQGYNRREIQEEYQTYERAAQKIWDDTYARTKSWSAANEARRQFRETAEYKEVLKKYWNISNEHPNKVMVKWGDFSDVISGATQDKVNLGMHHERKYWRETTQQRGKEMFAECASAKATNPESYALLKEYLPNTIKAFEEIYEKLSKGEIKSYGRAKWKP